MAYHKPRSVFVELWEGGRGSIMLLVTLLNLFLAVHNPHVTELAEPWFEE